MSGYATPYLTGYATPYAPGSAPAATTPVVPTPAPGRGGYFTGYATGYATGYFPGSVGGVAPPVVVGSFVAAIGTALVADATLMALVGGVVGGGAPAKVFYEQIPVKTRDPFIRFLLAADDRQYISTSGDYIHSGIVQVSGFARTSEAARVIGNRAATVLMAGWAAGSILWPDGRLMLLREATPLSPMPPSPAQGSGKLWQAVRQLTFKYSGVF